MKKVPVEQLKIGMIIGKSVCTKDGTLLFAPGTEIEAFHLKQLLDLGIKQVEIKDSDSGIPDNSELTRNEVILTVRSIIRDITLTNSLEKRTVKQAINNIFRRVLKDKCAMLHLTEVRGLDSYIFTHSVNVCMLSLIIGLFLKIKGDQLRNLGLAALLHDVGIDKVSKSILYKPAQLAHEEYEKVKKHTVLGYEMLKACQQFDDSIPLTALQHHERLDGSGYPYGTLGEEISLFPRIVAVADVFDALLTDRPFRKAFFPHQAVEIILNSSSGQFDPQVLKVFVENVAIYPMGSVVLLNNGETGVVVDMNKGRQTRPVVRIMYDKNRQKLNCLREVDLSKLPGVYITKILREEQVEDIIG